MKLICVPLKKYSQYYLVSSVLFFIDSDKHSLNATIAIHISLNNISIKF